MLGLAQAFDTIPNNGIEWEKVLYRLRSVISVLLNTIRLTELLPGRFCMKAMRYFFSGVSEADIKIQQTKVPGRQEVSLKILLKHHTYKKLTI